MRRKARDQRERNLAIRWIDGPVLVEAGAGTGKTELMVDRVLHLVRSEGVPIEGIVAITFTIKAAAELRGRIRAALAKGVNDPDGPGRPGGEDDTGENAPPRDDAGRARLRTALDNIDRAPISTIHSFALRLLQERPIEAGLRPGAGDVDPAAFEDLRDRVWTEWLRDSLVEGDPAVELFLELGFTKNHLESVRDALLDFPELRGGFPRSGNRTPEEILKGIRGAFEKWRKLADANCLDTSDKAYAQLDDISGWVDGLPASSLPALMNALWSPAVPLDKRVGGPKAWGGREGLKAFREGYGAFIDAARSLAGHEVLAGVAESLSSFADILAARAREEGILNFAGILDHAARLVRGSGEVRDYFRGRFRHFLVDEFQDTDPLQAELIFRLAGGDGGEEDWRKIRFPGGGVFVVGDPKQSIYRFRRADIAIYHGVKKLIEGAPGGKVIQITENFRSAPGVIGWVNEIFGRLIRERGSIQPGYENLGAHREEEGTRVRLITGGDVEERMSAADLRRLEAARAANEINKLVDEKIVVHPKGEKPRAVRYGDIVLLSRTRGAFQDFEEALGRLGIPAAPDGGSGYYTAIEVAAAGAVLWAVAHPGDPLAMTAALRSPLYGFSDVDLARWRLYGEDEKDLSEYPAEMDEAAAEIRAMHDERGEMSARALLAKIFEKTQAFELFLSSYNGERRAANLLKLLDIAFEYEGGGARGVDEFAIHLSRQLALGTEAKEPEEAAAGDEERVRMMTIHGSKGLEFPMVILADLGGVPQTDEMTRIADRESGRVHLKIGPRARALTSAGYAGARAGEAEIQEAERRRLLYVAATRARDWLVLSSAAAKKGNLWEILEAGGIGEMGTNGGAAGLMVEDEAGSAEEIPEPEAIRLPENAFEGGGAENQAARRRREDARERLGRLLAPGERVRPLSPSALPEISRAGAGEAIEDDEGGNGRYGISDLEAGDEPGGRDFGTLVHALLARMENYGEAAADRLAEPAREQARELKLAEKEAEAALGMIRGAMGMEIFRRAEAAERCWRELPVLMIEGGCLLRGVADLVFEEAGGLIVVDFKTDAVAAGETQKRAEHYRPQGTAYAMALEGAAGLPVREVVFAFLRAGEAAQPSSDQAQPPSGQAQPPSGQAQPPSGLVTFGVDERAREVVRTASVEAAARAE
jgi:ATP-dependent exoDNAse (exonuclease V) beta subunit